MMGDYGKEAGSQFGKGVRQAAGWQSKDEILQGIHEQGDYTTPQGVKAVLDKLKAVDYQEYQKAKTAIEDSGVNLAQIENYKASTAASIASQDRAATEFKQQQTIFTQSQDSITKHDDGEKAIRASLSNSDINTPEGKQRHLAVLNSVDPALGNEFVKNNLAIRAAKQQLVNYELTGKQLELELNTATTKISNADIEEENRYRINQINAILTPDRIREKLKSLMPSVDVSVVNTLDAARIAIFNSGLTEGDKKARFANLAEYVQAEAAAYYNKNKWDKDFIKNNAGVAREDTGLNLDTKVNPDTVNPKSKIVTDLESQIETLQKKPSSTLKETVVNNTEVAALVRQKDEAIKALPGRVNVIVDELNQIRGLDTNELSSVEIDALIQQVESLLKDNEADLGDKLRQGRISDKYTGGFTLARGPSATEIAMSVISSLMSAPNYVDKPTGI